MCLIVTIEFPSYILRRNRTYIYSQENSREHWVRLGEQVMWRISVFVYSQYSSLCAEYILGISEFSEKTNISEYRM